MNPETIIVAILAGLGPAIIGLIPVYWKLRQEEVNRRVQDEKDKADRRIQAEKAARESTQNANTEMIRRLSERIDNLENDRDELEERLDTEREKRRQAESQLSMTENKLSLAEFEINRLKDRIIKLEKRDTGELKTPPRSQENDRS